MLCCGKCERFNKIEKNLHIYSMLEKVLKPTINHSVECNEGSETCNRNFVEMNRQLMIGNCYYFGHPSQVSKLADFDDAVRLYHGKEEVANYNHEKLTKLQYPVAHIHVHHSSPSAKRC